MKKIIFLILTLVFSISSNAQLANESFEAATFPPTTPAAWATFDNGVGIRNWATFTIANSGIKAAYMNQQAVMPAGSISRDYLATPAINVPINAQVKFFTRTTLSTPQVGTKYTVRIKPQTSGAQNDPTGYAIIQEWDDTNLATPFNVYQEKVVNIPAIYNNTQVYVAFVYEYTSTGVVGGNRWLVDDAKVVANCVGPTSTTFTATGITNAEATFGWTAVPGATGYQ
ncbi:MAG: choice-of-anchor J domain-containing protein, partial [Flavobacterium sp.]|nr:choice-of-anchor J domain-containing protein [Flavobacterium sp.]